MNTILEIRNLTCGYDEAPPALKNLSLSLGAGERIALLGRNGAGKSTLFQALAGILPLNAGKIVLEGTPVTKKEWPRLRRTVGLVFQDPEDQIIAPTVEAEVAFGPRNLGLSQGEVDRRVGEALSVCGLDGFQRRAPHALSGGEKKRVTIAGVLAMEPKILLLDEPAAGLDPQGADQLEAHLEELHRRGLAIVVATHDVDFAWRWADRVVVLSDGALAADGKPEDIFKLETQLDAWGLKRPVLYCVGEMLNWPSPPRRLEDLEVQG